MPKRDEPVDVLSLLGLARDELGGSITRRNILNYQPYPKQQEFHACDAPGRFVSGANRSGKSDCTVCEAIWWATDTHPYLKRPERWGHGPLQLRYVVVDIIKGIEGIILPKLKRWCSTSMLVDGEFSKSWDQRTLTFTFSNGSTIQFLTHQMELDKHGGVPLHAVFFDEEPPQSVFNENMMRLIDYDGFWVIAATPVNGMTWTFDLLWEPAVSGATPHIRGFQLRQSDNPYLMADANSRSKFYVGMSAEDRAIREEGEFVARSGRVFPHFSKETHVLPEPFMPPREWTWYSSVDFGWNNPTAWLWHAAGPDGRIVTFAEHYKSEMTTAEHAAVIHEREREWRRTPDIRIGDPAGNQHQMNTGMSVIAEYARLGIGIGTEVPKDPMVGIEKMQQYYRLEERNAWGENCPRWMISPNCVNLIRELQRLRWADYESQKKAYDTNKQEVVHKKNDHAFDSKRYLASLMPDLTPDPFLHFDGSPQSITFEQLMSMPYDPNHYDEKFGNPYDDRVQEVWDTQTIDDSEMENFW